MTTPEKNFVAYYRLSKEGAKQKEGRSLGLDAQRSIVEHFYKDKIGKEFVEVQSAKNITDRKELQAAIKYCQDNNCTLVVAKIDRLSRDVDDGRHVLKVLSNRLRSCDIPGDIDKFTLTMYLAFAERERELISLRTSQALRAKIAREGSWSKGSAAFKDGSAVAKSNEALRKKAAVNPNNKRATAQISLLINTGMKIPQIVAELNKSGHTTSTGKEFHYAQVQRITGRLSYQRVNVSL